MLEGTTTATGLIFALQDGVPGCLAGTLSLTANCMQLLSTHLLLELTGIKSV